MMIASSPHTPKRSTSRRDPLNPPPKAGTPLKVTARSFNPPPLDKKPSAQLEIQIGRPSSLHTVLQPSTASTGDGIDTPSSIPAWAGRVVSSSPPPLSTYHRSDDGTQRNDSRLDDKKVVIDGIERETWEVLTEKPTSEPLDQSEDMVGMRTQHARQITHYRNLLVRAQSASSASLHDLHSKLHDLEGRYKALQHEHASCESRLQQAESRNDLEREILNGLSGEGTVRGVVQNLTKEERVGMLGIIAESCLASDIDAQIKILERYKRSKLDILGLLPDSLVTRVLLQLDIPDVLNIRLVCRRYRDLCDHPEQWRRRCRRMEWGDGNGEAGVSYLGDVKDHEWQPFFTQLWQREKNWETGSATRVAILTGHSNYVTSLRLRGDILISGSYDETIRIWDLSSNKRDAFRPPMVLKAKAVSCLDYYPPEDVLVAGTHDVGRVQVFRKDLSNGTWGVTHTLSGHLHGIKAVAIGDKWLVSAGADKALVVWNWRTGEKLVRFGQQTNICVNIQLVHDHIVAVTVDGVVRVFSIKGRGMIAQYQLSDLRERDSEADAQLKEVGGGMGGSGMINWFEGQGRDMICATREIIFRLEWDEIDEGSLETAKPVTVVPGYASPRTRTQSMSRTVSAPITPSKSAVTRPHAIFGNSQSPLKRASTASSPSTRSPTVSTTPRKTMSRRTSTAPSSITEEPTAALRSRMMPDFTKPPILKEIVKTSDVERGAVDVMKSRIVTSTRFASRAGADRHVRVV